jgi:hypothetical protein
MTAAAANEVNAGVAPDATRNSEQQSSAEDRTLSGAIKAHPVAEMLPVLDEGSDQFKSLLASIDRNGQYDAIVVDDEGRILDGRNRLRACQILRLVPKITRLADLALGLDKEGAPVSPEDFAFDRNFGRRDLTPDQRAIISAQFAEYIAGGKRGAPAGNGNNNPAKKVEKSNAVKSSQLTPAPTTRKPETRKRLAQTAGVSQHKAQQALDVARADPATAKAVAAGKMKLAAAHKQAKPKLARKPPAKRVVSAKDLAQEYKLRIANDYLEFSSDERVEFINRLRAILGQYANVAPTATVIS